MEETNSNSQPPENPEEQTNAEQPQPQPEQTPPEEISKDARNWAMLCHLLAIFTGFVAPLIIWLLKREDDPFIDRQGKEALNFQISVILAMVVAGLLSTVCIGVPLLIAIPVLNLIFCLIAAVRASSGQDYRYPVALRLVK